MAVIGHVFMIQNNRVNRSSKLVLTVALLMAGTARVALASDQESVSQTTTVPEIKAASSGISPAESISILDERRQFALGMIETGNQDDEVGRAGEVSRYQIMPSVWRHYSSSDRYRNPEISLSVAQQHWAALYNYFKQRAHRDPDDFDMYVLWNTRQGYYASRGFSPARLHPVVRERAGRFVNLLTRREMAAR